MFKPREHQVQANLDIRAFLKDTNPFNKYGVVVQPCGAGKSFIIAMTVQMLKTPVLVIQPTKELLSQNYDKYITLGGEATIYSASFNTKELSSVTYSTPGSIKNIGKDIKDLGVKVIIIDECHYKCTKGGVIDKLIKQINPSKVIGLTATPVILEPSLDLGSSLLMLNRTSKSIFNSIIHVTQIKDIISNGYWTNIIYHNEKFDSKSLVKNSSGNDFTDSSIIKSFEDNNTLERIVDNYNKMISKGVKHILIFVPSVEKAYELNDLIKGSEVVTDETKPKDRSSILKRFLDGVTRCIINFGILGTGFDFPSLDGVINARTTNSFAVYYQFLGRGVRLAENKKEYHYVDLGGNIDRFGKVEDIIFEDFLDYGWGMFSGSKLLTGYPLIQDPKFKKDLIKVVDNKPAVNKSKIKNFWFGKHSGKHLARVPKVYIDWLLKQDSFKWYHKDYKQVEVEKFKTYLKALVNGQG